MTNFAAEVPAAAADSSDRPAVKLDDLVLTYGLLDGRRRARPGCCAPTACEAGDRVGMQLPNVPYFPVVYYGALRLGAVVVPMNPLLKEREVAYHLSDSGAKVLRRLARVRGGGAQAGSDAGRRRVRARHARRVRAAARRGRPGRGDRRPRRRRPGGDHLHVGHDRHAEGRDAHARQPRRGRATSARELVDAGPDSVGARDAAAVPRVRHELGDEHGGAGRAGCSRCVPRFEPGKVLEVIQRDKVTTFAGVPTMYTALLHHPGRERLRRLLARPLRVRRLGDAGRGAARLRRGVRRKVLEGYGLSETTGMGSFNLPDRERKPGSIGAAGRRHRVQAGRRRRQGRPGRASRARSSCAARSS